MAFDAERTDEPLCSGCGAPQSSWSAPSGAVSKAGDIHCCQDCAEGRACACDPARREVA